MTIFLRNIIFFLLIVFVSACSTVKKPPDIVNATANDAKLIALSSWQLRGRMAFKSENETVSTNIRWIQSGEEFEFILSNVIGVTLLELNFKDGLATLNVDDKTYQGSDPELLIWQVSQWQIPIANMQRWVKGLSNQQEMAQRDERGLLRSIIPVTSQVDWQVDYTEYTQASDVVLPRQLTITKRQPLISIKFKVNEWVIE